MHIGYALKNFMKQIFILHLFFMNFAVVANLKGIKSHEEPYRMAMKIDFKGPMGPEDPF